RLSALEFTFCHSLFPWTAWTFSSVECGAISEKGQKTQASFAQAPSHSARTHDPIAGIWR
ncbi:hypothetical protein, partial [Mesorhizobium sp. SARCC-RB16n]|uniref:hypothetical protein n=1 Tax=Mesorhizobium sp. SARCC-RB16n TaxID=2116687 RepID=UPI001AEEB195